MLRDRISRLLKANDILGIDKNVAITRVGDRYRVVFRWYRPVGETLLIDKLKNLHQDLLTSANRDVAALLRGLGITLNRVVVGRISCAIDDIKGMVLSYADGDVVEDMELPEIISVCEDLGFKIVLRRENVEELEGV